MKSVKKLIRKALESWVYHVNRLLGYTYWLHIGDLLTPCDGSMTGGQYIISSRVLDIELMEKGNHIMWQPEITEKINNVRKNKDERVEDEKKFKCLVDSLNERGLHPIMSQCSTSDFPICLNNGTHRLGWCIRYQPDTYLQCQRIRQDVKPWFPINGSEYFDGILGEDKRRILEKRYMRIINEEVRTFLTCYILKENKEKLEEVISKYGRIHSFAEANISNNAKYSVYRFYLERQFLYLDHKKICSKYVVEMNKLLENRAVIGHTVMESILIEAQLEEKMQKKLQWKNK